MENANLKKGFILVLLLATGCIYSAYDSDINKALIEAVKARKIKEEQESLNKGENLNTQNEHGFAPLDCAVHEDYTRKIKKLKPLRIRFFEFRPSLLI